LRGLWVEGLFSRAMAVTPRGLDGFLAKSASCAIITHRKSRLRGDLSTRASINFIHARTREIE